MIGDRNWKTSDMACAGVLIGLVLSMLWDLIRYGRITIW